MSGRVENCRKYLVNGIFNGFCEVLFLIIEVIGYYWGFKVLIYN